MKFGFVIGNGESRKGFNLATLRSPENIIYGCNALYRDFHPDVLVSTDRKVVREIQRTKYEGEYYYSDNRKMRLHSSDGYHNYRYKGYDTGATAVWLMCFKLNHYLKDIILIGFDFFSKNKLHNNIYKGTENYRNEYQIAVNPHRHWISNFTDSVRDYPSLNFFRVINAEWQELKLDYKNYFEISYERLAEMMGG